MEKLKDYLLSRKENIQHFEQDPFFWKAKYQNTSVMDFPEFREVYDDLPEPISRQMVIEIFKSKDLFYSFIAAMVWGGINATRPQKGHSGNYTTTDFYLALKSGKDSIERIMNNVEEQMSISIENAADCVISEDTRINGVGLSFYTKILYFLSFRHNNCPVRPLIYDRWGRYMHAALLFDENHEAFNEFYTPKFYDKGAFSHQYENYVTLMSQMSNELELDDPGRLEAFLFGQRLNMKVNRTQDNPRFFLKKYVEDNICI